MNAIRAYCLILLVGCQVRFDVRDDANIGCTVDEDCRPGNVCQATTRTCLQVQASDNVAPSIILVTPLHHEAIRVSFSEPMNAGTIANAAAYALLPALEVRSVLVEDAQSVLLSVASQTAGTQYTLTLVDAADVVGNPLSGTFVFAGLGPMADALPPDPIFPDTDAVIYASTTLLKWTARELATSHEVDVAYDPLFANPIEGSPFQVESPSLALTQLQARSHFWRVRSNATQAGVFGASRFDVVVDRVRVSCPADPCDGSGAGNLTSPLRSITKALLIAAAHGFDRIDVAARPGGLAYAESISLVTPGISLYGAYGLDFSDSPTRTRIKGVAPQTVSITGIKDVPTRLQGFSIEASPYPHSEALAMFDVGSAVVVDNCEIVGASGEGDESIAVNIDRTGSVLPTIVDSVIRAGDGYAKSYAIKLVFASALLNRNRITAGTAVAESFGIFADAWDNSAPGVWSNNLIVAGSATLSTGVRLENGLTVLTNNVISGQSYAIDIANSPPLLTNNILMSPNICMRRSTGTAVGGSLHANVFADCSACVRSYSSVCYPLSSDLNDAASMLGTAPGVSAISGNVSGGTSAAIFVAAPNDFHLLDTSVARSSGIDASQAICGPSRSASCGGVVDDIAHAMRTPPYSSGAYESD